MGKDMCFGIKLKHICLCYCLSVETQNTASTAEKRRGLFWLRVYRFQSIISAGTKAGLCHSEAGRRELLMSGKAGSRERSGRREIDSSGLCPQDSTSSGYSSSPIITFSCKLISEVITDEHNTLMIQFPP